MARVESLGIHLPTALPYLIREGILPADPKKDLYQWDVYVSELESEETEEELLVTKHCVVWSQGSRVRNVYRFELEGEDVTQALLTQFPGEQHSNAQASSDLQVDLGTPSTRVARPFGQTSTTSDSVPVSTGEGVEPDSRALIVFLKTKAHVYYLQGARHIIDLPFEVEWAFPAPRGCILRRKPSTAASAPPTPQIPSVPPNSFFFSRSQASASFLHSPTLAKSFGRSQPARPSPLSGGGRLDALLQDVLGSPATASEDEPASLYSLSSPLTDLGVLAYSIQHYKPRLLSKSQGGVSVEFETLDNAEQIVKDELKGSSNAGAGELMLIVTFHNDLHTLTVWHAWYIEDRPLKDLLKQRAAHKAAKARRRSSFLSANVGTGVNTPAVRTREHTRESFAGGASLRLPGEPHPSQPTAKASRKATKQDDEEAMASQLDPDYMPLGSQQPLRESRRISSLNTDIRTSQNTVAASFAGAGGRRNTSFGGPADRKSFGHRKSRGSTPVSMFSRSHGADDDFMDIGGSDDAEALESVDGVVRHIRATFEAAGADSLFGNGDEGFRRELMVRKLHSVPLDARSHHASTAASFKVAVLGDPHHSIDSTDSGLGLYVCDRTTQEVSQLKIIVKQRPLWPTPRNDVQIAIPIVVGQKVLGKATDLVKIGHGEVKAILLSGLGLILSNDGSPPCPLPHSSPYRAHGLLDVDSLQGVVDTDIGRNRTLQVPPGLLSYSLAGVRSTFDEIDTAGTHHRRRLQLRPDDPHIERLIEVCHVVLPQSAVSFRQIWCMAREGLSSNSSIFTGTGASHEWLALVAAVLFFAVGLLDSKALAALNLSKVASGQRKAHDRVTPLSHHEQVGLILASKPAWSWTSTAGAPALHSPISPNTKLQLHRQKDQLLPLAAALADELSQTLRVTATARRATALSCSVPLMLGLHVFREEQKLSVLSVPRSRSLDLTPIISQLGQWLGLHAWGCGRGSYYYVEGANEGHWTYVKPTPSHTPRMALLEEPIGIYQWFEHAMLEASSERFPTLSIIAGLDATDALSTSFITGAHSLTPRICALSDILVSTSGLTTIPSTTVELMAKHGLAVDVLETLPQAVAAPFQDAIVRCERDPPTSWPGNLLQLVGREDALLGGGRNGRHSSSLNANSYSVHISHDVVGVCHALEPHSIASKTREAARHSVSQLIFSQDRRLVEATSLMRYYSTQEAECAKQPDWSDAHHFDQQRRVLDFVTMRMWALPAGDGMLHYDCVAPLLTEKYTPHGFGSRCLMNPMGITLNIDRSTMTEEKVGWAYFHAGVSSGLRISKHVTGIDTSWVAFNKPAELTNRHAGLLLALGLGGHLRTLAKWLSFKYLTPKHTMTSVGIVLGLSASHIGTMDSMITRMLSVHITRMLPPGAAELNVSPITQTAGLMGIGLLYFNTMHRRMSEIMISEIEFLEVEDPDSGPDPLRDESYRLAAGFALGLINLGKGKDLRGLHGMHLPERLLGIAIGSRPVHAVHVFDRATAGAIIAVTLIFMKSGDKSIAGKISIPDTEAQFDHVRPDMLLLRAMAGHVITWHNIDIRSGTSWIEANLPACYKGLLDAIRSSKTKQPLQTSDVPFYNILTGLAWAVSLKYAGSGDAVARDEILRVLDMFYMISGESYYYDAKLARATVRRCIDVLALAASTVMAGTGDLATFRYLRRLHGRTDAETPYGSHLAAHLAIGVLFMGGGTYTFGTSDFAIASLIAAFYPLFPADVHDNRCHLQAFRHLWVFAAEARCLVVEDIDTRRPIKMPVTVTMRTGEVKALQAPCLLPELDTVARVQTVDQGYWTVTLDFAGNAKHLTVFRENQTIFARRCPASEAHESVFGATLAALNDAQSSATTGDLWYSIFSLPALKDLDKAAIELILPPDVHSSIHFDERGSVVDDRLALSNATSSNSRDDLWNLRMLLAWAGRAQAEGGGKLRWLGHEVLEVLRAKTEERSRMYSGLAD
ncbi:Anaphase-promoting complex subunit 1 [Teratosphaeriaceae sp. CCFEE 6253]|nr:Anaphase-promoting complex subunit 1 [Teratosphaeriaceae sp. CCFEE 6253]